MKVSSLKNKHQGKRAFIVGNGSSLNNTDMDLLIGEYSFAMNRISLIYKRTKWRPNFFICTTTNIVDMNWRKDILKTINMGITTFAWDKLKKDIGKRDNVYYLNCTNGREVTTKPLDSWWSDDISKRVTKFGTSLIVALQAAVYLGFNPIYLIGCDLGYSVPSTTSRVLDRLGLKRYMGDKNHFDPKYNTPGLPPNELNANMLAAHKLIKRNTKRLGVEIYNATLGGQLDIYPRKNFDDLFKNA